MLTTHSAFQEQKEPNPKSYLTLLFWLCVFPCLLSYKSLLVSYYKTSRFISDGFGSHWDILKFFIYLQMGCFSRRKPDRKKPLAFLDGFTHADCCNQMPPSFKVFWLMHQAKQVSYRDRTDGVNITAVWLFWWVIAEDFLGTNLHGNKDVITSRRMGCVNVVLFSKVSLLQYKALKYDAETNNLNGLGLIRSALSLSQIDFDLFPFLGSQKHLISAWSF